MVLTGASIKAGVWYRNKYPTDDCGNDINDVTFGDLWCCLHDGKDFYDFSGVSDSIVRERLFVKMAEIFKCSYDFIYGMWIAGSNV